MNTSCNNKIEEPRRVLAAHAVLVERRNVEERRRAANGVVLALVGKLVGARDYVPGPTTPRVACAERCGALVERSGLQQLEAGAGLLVEIVRVLRTIAQGKLACARVHGRMKARRNSCSIAQVTVHERVRAQGLDEIDVGHQLRFGLGGRLEV